MIQQALRVFEPWAEAFLAERGLPGMAVAMTEGGREVYARGFGSADGDPRHPVTADTLFGIGSITKSFTAVALCQLSERGRLDLDGSVARVAPELARVFGDRVHDTTVAHVLNHATGLPPLPYLAIAMRESLDADPDARGDLEALDRVLGRLDARTYGELMETLARYRFPWLGDPGQVFSYSNDAYGLAGLLVERTSGVPYEEYVREEILRPAALSRAAFGVDEALQLGNVATLHRHVPKVRQGTVGEAPQRPRAIASPVWHEAPAMTAAGFLKMSARDLARAFCLYTSVGRVGETVLLAHESVARMTAGTMRITPTMGYGFGLQRVAYRDLTLVQHSGGLKGVSAFAMAIPDLDLTIVALIHVGNEPASRVGLALLNCVLEIDPDAYGLPPAGRSDPGGRPSLEGQYWNGEDFSGFAVRAGDDGALDLVGADGERQALRAVGTEGDYLAGEGREAVFVRPVLDGSKVTALRLGTRTHPRRERWEEAGFPLPVPSPTTGERA